jgi:Cu2+-containing amine oxidase
MKKTTIILFATIAFTSTSTLAQKIDTLLKARIDYISKDLALDKDKAAQVVAVMDDYKQKVKTLTAENKLSEVEKRAKFNLLVDEKNTILKKIVNNMQFEKIVPTTERQTNDTIQ